MKAVKKPRNRAAQDATLINIRALDKRVSALELTVQKLVKELVRQVRARR